MISDMPQEVVKFLGESTGVVNSKRYSVKMDDDGSSDKFMETASRVYADVKDYYNNMNSEANRVVLGLLENSIIHGDNDTSLDVFANHNSLVFGYSGKYFKDEDAKTAWESGVDLGRGSRRTHDSANLVLVDDFNGVLYVGFSVGQKYAA